MPSAELIAIGTELLLGEIQDTNTRYLARNLRDLGIDLYRTSTIGDNEERIAALIQEALQRSQIIITTGGLGPTVDDPTRQAVARALGLEVEFRSDLWEQIQERFQRYGRVASGNNQRQAYTPAGAIPVENPVGTAPAFICEVGDACIASLPGVPREMEYLYQNAIVPYLRKHYDLSGIIKARVIHTAGMGESMIDDLVGDLEKQTNPTVGLLAHPGQVDVRITAKAASEEAADRMIAEVEAEIRRRLGDNIYGADQENMESAVRAVLEKSQLHLAGFECNLNGELRMRLQRIDPNSEIQTVEGICDPSGLELVTSHLGKTGRIVLAASLQPVPNKLVLTIYIKTSSSHDSVTRYYGGPPQHGPVWAANTALDFLRRTLANPGSS
jgi:competence/damage-inducible protein CinA-like protein